MCTKFNFEFLRYRKIGFPEPLLLKNYREIGWRRFKMQIEGSLFFQLYKIQAYPTPHIHENRLNCTVWPRLDEIILGHGL